VPISVTSPAALKVTARAVGVGGIAVGIGVAFAVGGAAGVVAASGVEVGAGAIVVGKGATLGAPQATSRSPTIKAVSADDIFTYNLLVAAVVVRIVTLSATKVVKILQIIY
jgi:hypothetical protein